jgi:hypothetical protein
MQMQQHSFENISTTIKIRFRAQGKLDCAADMPRGNQAGSAKSSIQILGTVRGVPTPVEARLFESALCIPPIPPAAAAPMRAVQVVGGVMEAWEPACLSRHTGDG